MHPKEYWELTIGDFYDCLDGYVDRIEMQARLDDINNFNLGQYVAAGVHASRKHPYPKKPMFSKENGNKAQGFTKDSALDSYIRTMAKKEKQ